MMMRTCTAMMLALAVLALPGCKASKAPVVGEMINGLTGMPNEAEARLRTAAHSAMAQGRTDEALGFYAKLHDRQPKDAEAALNYAQLLRRIGKTEKAVEVLEPFVIARYAAVRDNALPAVVNEYAAANTELGKLELAETALNHVLEDKTAEEYHNDAYNLMGVVMDAKGQHKEAEEYFREALDGWKGDPSSVMNNLGLNLAAQGMFDQSLSVLRQALIKAPKKTEIAKNIQLVSDLRKAYVPTAPIDILPAEPAKP